MKKTLLSGLALAVAATSGFVGTANAAQPYNNHQQQQRDDHRNDNFRNGAYEVNGHRYERQRGPAWHAPKHWQRHNWQRGQRMPVEYRRVPVDYRSYHLAPPPRGYQYVRDGNDVVLTAIASGIIGAVIANVFVN